MRQFSRIGWRSGAFLLVLGLALTPILGISRVRAASKLPPGPDRFSVVTVDYNSYEWWLIDWSDNDVACRVVIDHTGLPTGGEIYNTCGKKLYDAWYATDACPEAADGGEVSACLGYYLHFFKTTPAHKKVGVALPPPVVWVSLSGCSFGDSTNLCRKLPTLVLTGDEPLPNEKITGITFTTDGKEYTCGRVCEIDLPPTGENGILLSFWAYSSYGDSSQVFEAQVRVKSALGDNQNGASWYVDVLSTQWRGGASAGCAQTWEAFPPVGGPPAWLSTPDWSEELASNIPYEYLAANLITQGVVDVKACPDGGLLPNGAVSPCGLKAARSVVNEWQNRFDGLIYKVAGKTGVPAQLLKNLFSRESQFWPGVFTNKLDVGLGQLTENGADTALLWNQSFFEQFCPLVLENKTCQKRYAFLKPDEQKILRGALVQSVDAVCKDCPLGIDLRQADFSVDVFAQTLLANCEQIGSIVHDVTGQVPGEVSTYEDLWRFTLVNYNAGPGCLSFALNETADSGEPLDWDHVSTHLTKVCKVAIDYIADISR